MAITLRDVASKSGFSLAAVSKALHGRGDSVRVSKDTIEKIKSAAQELNYRPNRLARSLRENKTYSIGLIFRELGRLGEGPMFKVQVIDAMNEVFVPAGYDLTLLHGLTRGQATDELEDGRFDGLMWCRMGNFSEIAKAVERARMPMVALATPQVTLPVQIPTFCCNDQQGMDLVVQYLVQIGHRKIAYLETENEVGSLEGDSRSRAFLDAIHRYGIDYEIVILHDIHNQLKSLFSGKNHPTALFAWNEHLGGLTLKACADLQIKIPADISVATFDSTMYCESVSPRLTAVRQPTEQMAKEASLTLLAMIENREFSLNHRSFSCSLDIRESTSAPRL